ncbi:non-ribosomal peptide synthetase/type I polyketide synthase [Pseudooceanicola aestuarii]|uniref:non-ribosomal peptide synthetase/type I polyketide synthase n=1 Tax=Pseudooceanicola aestuarii TaxID=2697319 RepID=UPI0013D810DE|nr:non-ribosomal peptide synthetase/type I polyketide synthase [Pseudooceanicola aestuarii]
MQARAQKDAAAMPEGVFARLATHVAAAPRAPALLCAAQVIDYASLATRAEAEAFALHRAGIGRGARVAILAGRGVEAIVAMLACLRLGAAYVPLDPGFAPEHLHDITDDVNPAALLATPELAPQAGVLTGWQEPAQGPVQVLGQAAPAPDGAYWPHVQAGDAACILYTSGTSGRPKGVVLPQRALTAMAGQPQIAMTPGDVALHAATIACDGSLYDIMVPLLSGAAVAVVPQALPGLDDVARVMTGHRVTVASWYAGLHHLMIDHQIDAFASLRLSLAGGDVMSVPHARRLLARYPDLRLLNVYGPTETCAQSLWHQVTPDDLATGDIPIGQPLPGEEAVLLGDDLAPVPDGQGGQIAIGGSGLAQGYFGRDDLTAAAFIADPRPGRTGEGARRLYLTGDLAVPGPDGALLFRGRSDRQVKLAGRRVELDGVEATLRNLPGIADAAVEVEGAGTARRLAAFVVVHTAAEDMPAEARIADLRAAAAGRISEAVMPRRIELLPSLPLTRAGKVDRKALRARLAQGATMADGTAGPDSSDAEVPGRAGRAVARAAAGSAEPRSPGDAGTETRIGQTETAATESILAESIAPEPARAEHAATRTETARDLIPTIAAIWQSVLGGAPPAPGQTFFDLGGTSLQLIEVHALMERDLARRFDIATLFDTPRLGDLAGVLARLPTAAAAPPAEAPVPAVTSADRSHPPASGAIAIVGMAARLPGVADLTQLWDVLQEGRSVITRFDPAEAEDSADPATRARPDYVPARSILPDVDQFDAPFFGMRPREAAQTDPQGRIFLEIAQHALDDAGLDPQRFAGAVGVYAGASMSTYLLENLLPDRAALRAFTSGFQLDYTLLSGNDSDGIATRTAYRLGLTGAAVSVNTACSTSLVAIAQAVMALRAGAVDAALAGGVSITFPQKRGYLHQAGGMASPDGLCRPFDAQAGGTVFGHGAGIVVLKRLEDAQAAGDRIHAVIRGAGLNNDGADKMSYTAPSGAGQAAAIRRALADAGVAPSQIGHVECHGTATPLGDPVEIAGLRAAFDGATTPCALGSVKGNLGHLDAAAGVVGVIKTALVLQRGIVPPVPHFTALNPRITLEGTGFRVPQAPEGWPQTGLRRAGVSSFGVGGTNAHLVMEQAGPAPELGPVVQEGRAAMVEPQGDAPQILPLSAATPEALHAMAQRLADQLDDPPRPGPEVSPPVPDARQPDPKPMPKPEPMPLPMSDPAPLVDVARTLQRGRRQFGWRAAVVARTRAEAAAALRAQTAPPRRTTDAPEVIFLFPGQGAQYPGMGAGLYDSAPEYRHWIDKGAALLEPTLGEDLRPLLLGRGLGDADAARALTRTRLTQPALFLTEYALARLWEARGVRPDVMIGHSVGEFTAAALANVLRFEDALTLIAARGQLMMDQPAGAMLSVRASEDTLAPHLDGLEIAARNAPELQVVAGPEGPIAALAARLAGAGIATQPLQTSHAFHSAMMDPVIDPLRALAAGMTLRAPDRRIISTVTGAVLTAEQAQSPDYWARQARACVNFRAALTAACPNSPDGAERAEGSETRSPVLVEAGPGRILTTLAGQILRRGSHRGLFHSLPDHARSVSDDISMAVAASDLWSAGLPLDWDQWGAAQGRVTTLPAYPFQRRRHWVDPPEGGAAPPADIAPPPAIPTQERPAMINPAETSQGSAQAVSQTAPPAATDLPRKDRLIPVLATCLADLSGEEISAQEADVPFLELGFDSLFMGQVSQALARDFGVTIGFRRLLSDLSSLRTLAAHLDAEMPAEPEASPAAPATPTAAPTAMPPAAPAVAAQPAAPAPVSPQTPAGQSTPMAMAEATAMAGLPGAAGVMQAQLQTMQAVFAQQLQALGQPRSGAGAIASATLPDAPAGTVPQPSAPAEAATDAPAAGPAPLAEAPASEAPVAEPTAFRTGRGPSVTGGTLTAAQRAFARDLAARYSAKHPASKAATARHRATLADPRTAAGFRADWKELTFPIVAERAHGAWLHDPDGNDFVDLVNGFGQTAFGHSPDFVTEAVTRQMARGFPIGPQSDLAGPVAEKFARATGHQRVTFCNTGSEAVMAAMRLARTVTGREKIVVFDRDYHGQFDEVLVKGRARGDAPDALPIAPGIPRSGLTNMVVLRYGSDDALAWMRAHAAEVAGVIVEPVQSRHPAHRPEEFVRTLRQITREAGAALIMDEVVTGFRTGPRGMQGIWDIQGDMATYGKVVGGGMPIGVLAGDARWMDALDGGDWSFGDDSRPEAVPTFFAGTFVRHPLVLAAVDATLDHMEAHGDALWQGAAARCASLAARLGGIMTTRGLPDLIESYSSWFVINVTDHDPRASLLFPLMRMQGVHVMDGFCAFLTTRHGTAECDRVAAAFETALDQLLSVGILNDLRLNDPETGTANEVTRGSASAFTDPIPLTPGQREIWMAHQMGGLSAAAFNESGTLWLDGSLDTAALTTALHGLVARHEALRLRFARSGEYFTVEEPDCPLNRLDLSDAEDPAAALAALIAQDGAVPFDLTAAPPLRLQLVALAPERHALVLTAHHIAVDGWSFGVLLDDLAALYAAAVAGQAVDLLPAPSFAAHARSLAPTQAAGTGGQAAQALDHWVALHRDPAPLPDLPTDRPRPDPRRFEGGTVFHEIPAELSRAVKRAGGAQGCTLFATTFAAMQMLVHRLTGARDIVLGVPTAAQQQMERPDLVGHCVNFLPIRAPLAAKARVASHLATAREALMQAFDHQDTTFGTIVEALRLPRRMDRLPLTEIEFNLEKDGAVTGMPGVQAEFRPNAKQAVNFDLFFNLCETAQGLRIDAHYNAALLDGATVEGWCRAYETILAEIARQPDQPVATLPLLPAKALDRAMLCATPTDYDRSATLPDLVARGAALAPDALAVSAVDDDLTHAELAARSDALAALIQRSVPDQGQRVAVCLPRGAGMLVGLLAVLKAGQAYVPLDPRQPQARLRMICDTAQVAAILTDTPATAPFAGETPVILAGDAAPGDSPAPITTTPRDTAYVIFTSGSTGTPKGVAVPHGAVVNFLTSMAGTPGMGPQDRLLAVTTAMFDIAVLELFLPLITGAGLVIAPTEDVVDAFRLADRLGQGDITMMQATPTLWDMVLTAGFTPRAGLRMLCGGEPLARDLADRLTRQGAELWNMYGPTETTIWSALRRIEPGAEITVGGPIANTDLLILDPVGQPVLPGQTGELNIGGAGLAQGYFNRPDLTDRAFREVTIGGVARRLYATGDLARLTPAGEITVLGRIDTQVKLRGFRIELGEIETRLRAQPGIAQAAVDLRRLGTGDARLTAWLVTEPGQVADPAALARDLATDLPDYMIPRSWVTLEALPQTGNGKLDRKALPDPEESRPAAPQPAAPARGGGVEGRTATPGDAAAPQGTAILPATPTEQRIAAHWAAGLDLPEVSVTTPLFALGADSLAIFRIAARMLQDGLDLDARDMLTHSDVRSLAVFHDARRTQPTSGAGPQIRTRPALAEYRHGARRPPLGSIGRRAVS